MRWFIGKWPKCFVLKNSLWTVVLRSRFELIGFFPRITIKWNKSGNRWNPLQNFAYEYVPLDNVDLIISNADGIMFECYFFSFKVVFSLWFSIPIRMLYRFIFFFGLYIERQCGIHFICDDIWELEDRYFKFQIPHFVWCMSDARAQQN